MDKKINVFFGKYKFNTILGLLSIGIAFYVAMFTKTDTGYEWYFLIPGVFGFLLLIVRPLSFTDTGSIGPLILNYTMVIKYSISPLVSLRTEIPAESYPRYSSFARPASNIGAAC